MENGEEKMQVDVSKDLIYTCRVKGSCLIGIRAFIIIRRDAYFVLS